MESESEASPSWGSISFVPQDRLECDVQLRKLVTIVGRLGNVSDATATTIMRGRQKKVGHCTLASVAGLF